MKPRLYLTATLLKDAANSSNYFLRQREEDPGPSKISDFRTISKASPTLVRFKSVMCVQNIQLQSSLSSPWIKVADV